MSVESITEAGDPAMLAAEYALGVLDGERLREAQRLERSDPAFAEQVAEWNERLAPMLDEIAPATPRDTVWPAIASALNRPDAGSANVVKLRRSVTAWRGYSAAMTAIAASLAIVVGIDMMRETPVAPPPVAAPEQTLVATLASEDSPARLVVSWQPGAQSVLVTPTVLDSPAERDHQLWLIPKSGTPQSLGLLRADDSQRVVIPAELLRQLGEDVSIAVSVEPVGGSPTGLPTGPVIAAGQLHTI